MCPYGIGKGSFTQVSVLLYLKTEAEPVAETSCFFYLDGRQSAKKETVPALLLLCIFMHDMKLSF